MKNQNSKTKNQKGLTLIEMLVAIGIFLTIVGIATGLFISGVRAQRKSLAYQELLNQTSYVMEYMSRALRMAKKDDIEDCLSSGGSNFEITTSGQGGIEFRNYKDECQEFYLDNDRLKEVKDTQENFLTSAKLYITAFNIELSGQDQADDFQPRVTIFLDIEHTRESARMQIQTTISQRNLDVEY